MAPGRLVLLDFSERGGGDSVDSWLQIDTATEDSKPYFFRPLDMTDTVSSFLCGCETWFFALGIKSMLANIYVIQQDTQYLMINFIHNIQ